LNRDVPVTGHRFVERSGRSPLTPTIQTWSLEPPASPASIRAEIGNFLAVALTTVVALALVLTVLNLLIPGPPFVLLS